MPGSFILLHIKIFQKGGSISWEKDKHSWSLFRAGAQSMSSINQLFLEKFVKCSLLILVSRGLLTFGIWSTTAQKVVNQGDRKKFMVISSSNIKCFDTLSSVFSIQGDHKRLYIINCLLLRLENNFNHVH